jgi:hypothetical protein
MPDMTPAHLLVVIIVVVLVGVLAIVAVSKRWFR